MSRKEGGRGLASIADCMDASIGGVEDNIKKSEEGLITESNNNTDKSKTNGTIITKKQQWKENNCLDISNNKPVKSHPKRSGHGYKREILIEKLNLF